MLFQDRIVRDRDLTSAAIFFLQVERRFIDHGKSFSIPRMASDERFDPARAVLESAPDDRLVHTLGRMMEELPGKISVRFFGLRDDEQAGSIFIEPVNDAGTLRIG